jgi:hypothetical protein
VHAPHPFPIGHYPNRTVGEYAIHVKNKSGDAGELGQDVHKMRVIGVIEVTGY